MKKIPLKKIVINYVIDESPDLSDFEQFKDSNDIEEQKYYLEDQKRLQEYNDDLFDFYGIYISFVFELVNINNNNKLLQSINTEYLFGFASDNIISESEIYDAIENSLGYVKSLNIDIENYKELIPSAIKEFETKNYLNGK